MSIRTDTEKYIIKYIHKIAPGGENKKLYENLFKGMTNNEFDKFMHDLKSGRVNLAIIAPNNSKIKLEVSRNLEIAKELGYDFFQHIIIGGEFPYKTPIKYLVYKLPIRRAAQLLTKKISIPTDDKSIDLSTGQVTGKSKASKLTLPEIQILSGLGLKDSIKELMKVRGGDQGANSAMNTLLYKQGSVSQKVLDAYATGVVSTDTLRSYFYAAMIKNNL